LNNNWNPKLRDGQSAKKNIERGKREKSYYRCSSFNDILERNQKSRKN
jgi:hypothetical protein